MAKRVCSVGVTPGAAESVALAKWLNAHSPGEVLFEPDTGSGPDPLRRLFFVESPERVRGRELRAGRNADASTLQAWRAAAEAIAAAAQRHRDDVLIVDLEEASASPAGLLASCQAWLGVSLLPLKEPLPALPAADPVLVALASNGVDADRSLRGRWLELHHACAPLGEGEDTSPSSLRARASNAAIAGEAYLELRKTRDALATQLELARAENERAAAERISRATSTQTEQESSAHRAELQRAGEALSKAQSENELLVLQLHQVQEELEQYFLENEKLRARRPVATPLLSASMERAELSIGHHADKGPHRHLNLTLRNLMLPQRPASELKLRLVEHHGTPGLLLFAAARDAAPALQAWEASGEEGGRPFMLFHPSHQSARRWLERIGRSDWLLLNALSALVESTLQDRVGEASGTERDQLARWLVVGQRLRRQLTDLPPSLRYDALRVVAPQAGAGDGPDVELAFTNLHCGDRLVPELFVRWWTGHPAPRLVLRIEPEPALAAPLSIWPVADTGGWQPSLPLQFGSALSKRDARRQWSALSPADHDFVAALLRALGQWAAAAPPAGFDGRRAAQQAARMLAEARTARLAVEFPTRRSVSFLGLNISV